MTRVQAERAANAALRTLGERITLGEAADIAAFLPRELRDVVTSAPEPAEPFGLDKFVRRVAEREQVDRDTAHRHVHAVFVALGRAVAPGELNDMAAQLSRDFAPLLEAAGARRDAAEHDPIVPRVAELADLDPPVARRSVEAVLETLAVRISEGEVEDLIKRLPTDLTGALERGLARSRKATRTSLDESIAQVAEREDVDADEAKRRARAVFAARREFAAGKELRDVESELPSQYAPLFSGVV